MILEILSDDADHDLVRKDGVYAQFGVARRAFLDPRRRHGWWSRIDGVDHDGPDVRWHLDGWPELRFGRDGCSATDP